MFKKALIALALVVLTTGASLSPSCAQTSAQQTVLGNYVPQNSTNCPVGPCWAPYVGAPPLGYQQFTVATATSLPSIPLGATEAFVVCESQTVRWRDDGTNPTASVGTPLVANQGFPYTGTLATLKIIETTASATCNVSYYK